MSANSVALAYLTAAVLFIFALKGLSSPVSARRGNMFGMVEELANPPCDLNFALCLLLKVKKMKSRTFQRLSNDSFTWFLKINHQRMASFETDFLNCENLFRSSPKTPTFPQHRLAHIV